MGPFRQSVEPLADDLQRFAELGHSDAVTGEAIARGLDWHAEVEIFVRRVWLTATDVVGDTGSAKQRAADSNLLGELARNHSDALRADQEEGFSWSIRSYSPMRCSMRSTVSRHFAAHSAGMS